MTAQLAMPYPLTRMLEHLELDLDRCFRLTPGGMEDAMQTCLTCRFFEACDYNSESRYFVCPNRDTLDRLNDMLIEGLKRA